MEKFPFAFVTFLRSRVIISLKLVSLYIFMSTVAVVSHRVQVERELFAVDRDRPIDGAHLFVVRLMSPVHHQQNVNSTRDVY